MSIAVDETVVRFACEQSRLWGILSQPAAQASAIAILILVGGPQYRVGSHRQFVLLARALARAGYASLRFDYTGMGDSEGEMRGFDSAGPDVHAGLDALARHCPGASRIVVWGLCDAASAALMFAAQDARVAGIVAANPWARSEASLAAATVKHYYASRLVQREFWTKLLRGDLRLGASLGELWANLRRVHRARSPGEGGAPTGAACYQDAMAAGLARLRGRLLLILSGNDLTAKEFLEYTQSSGVWRGLLSDPKVTRVDLAQADHTFSQRQWLHAAEEATIDWLHRLDSPVRASSDVNTTREGER